MCIGSSGHGHNDLWRGAHVFTSAGLKNTSLEKKILSFF